MGKVIITDTLLNNLADSISAKTGEPTPMTLSDMSDAVDDIVVPSGTINITQNGSVNVTAYETANVSVSGGSPNLQTKSGTYTPTTSQQTDTITADSGYDGLNEVGITINAVPTGSVTAPSSISGTGSTVSTGTNTLTLTKTVQVTPNVTTQGYITSGTSGDSEVSLTANVNTRSSSDLTVSGATVTAPAGYYGSSASKSVSSGSATGPSNLSGTSATVSTGTNTLTLTKTGVTTTPTVNAGYVASATASTATVSLTANVTTKGAATYHPSTTDQTVAASQYLTGAQTIKAVTTSNLVSSNILNGVTIKVGDSSDDDCVASVTGDVQFVDVYVRSAAPTSSVGNDGDIYIQE